MCLLVRGRSATSVTAVGIMAACCRASALSLYLLACFLQVFGQGEGKTLDLWPLTPTSQCVGVVSLFRVSVVQRHGSGTRLVPDRTRKLRCQTLVDAFSIVLSLDLTQSVVIITESKND